MHLVRQVSALVQTILCFIWSLHALVGLVLHNVAWVGSSLYYLIIIFIESNVSLFILFVSLKDLLLAKSRKNEINEI